MKFVTLSAVLFLCTLVGCGTSTPDSTGTSAPVAPAVTAQWLGIPSAVNHVVVMLHDGTGWILNKSEVSIKKVGEVQPLSESESKFIANFDIKVSYGGESFETTATEVPCDKDGIPTEASVDRLRSAVEEIKAKMKRLQE